MAESKKWDLPEIWKKFDKIEEDIWRNEYQQLPTDPNFSVVDAMGYAPWAKVKQEMKESVYPETGRTPDLWGDSVLPELAKIVMGMLPDTAYKADLDRYYQLINESTYRPSREFQAIELLTKIIHVIVSEWARDVVTDQMIMVSNIELT